MDKFKIKALRINAGLNQTELGNLVGVSKQTIINWERYDTFPSAPQLIRLAKALGCTIDQIFFPEYAS